MKFKKTMKKDSLQKVFRRYIGIYDNIIYEKTGEHLKEDIIDKIQKQVDSLFEKYENIEEISDYINFSEKLIIIIKDVIKDAGEQGKSIHEQLVREAFPEDDLRTIEYIIKRVEESAINNGRIPDYYPEKFDQLASKYGYRVFIKNPESLAKKLYSNDEERPTDEFKFINFNRKNNEYNEFLNDEPVFFTKEIIDLYFKDDNFEKLCLCKNSVKNEIISYAIHYSPTVEQLKDEFERIDKQDYPESEDHFCTKKSNLLAAYNIKDNFKCQYRSAKNTAVQAIYNEALYYCKDILYKSVVKKENLQSEINNICEYLKSNGGKTKYFYEANAYINSENITENELVKIYTVLRKIKINQEELDLNGKYASLLLETISILILNVRNNSTWGDYNILNEYIKRDPTYYAKDEIVDIDLLIYFASTYKNILEDNTNISDEKKEDEKKENKEGFFSRIKRKIASIFKKQNKN